MNEQQGTASPTQTSEIVEKLDTVISRHIRYALSQSQGKVHGRNGAAELLGINPNTLRSRMQKLGIRYLKK
jgi:transcriptional regulator with GAF, ATPase, and Fis domain